MTKVILMLDDLLERARAQRIAIDDIVIEVCCYHDGEPPRIFVRSIETSAGQGELGG